MSESILQQIRDTYSLIVVINNNQTAKDRGHKSKVDSADTSLMASYPEHDKPTRIKRCSYEYLYYQTIIKKMLKI
jgi:hypothetical protein